ncbi:MAG: hypothetical protein V1722_02745 [Candidatus Micrarchaeota archaeon]
MNAEKPIMAREEKPAAATSVQKEAKEAKREDKKEDRKEEKKEQKEEKKKRQPRKLAFKQTQFDRDLLHLIREGTGNPDDLLLQLGVARSELMTQLNVLKTEQLVAEDSGVFGLTIKGYNFYAGKGAKKVSLKKTFTGEVKLQKHPFVARKPTVVESEGQKHVKDFLSTTEVVDLGGKLGKMDLEEIMKRYGPSPEQRQRFLQHKATGEPLRVQVRMPHTIIQEPVKTRVASSQSVPPQPLHQNESNGSNGNGEACDLCKSQFKLAVSDSALSKYGHCFCGAAYHKECYDSLLDGNAQCIRCGKKLLLIIDKRSRDVINEIKDAFE